MSMAAHHGGHNNVNFLHALNHFRGFAATLAPIPSCYHCNKVPWLSRPALRSRILVATDFADQRSLLMVSSWVAGLSLADVMEHHGTNRRKFRSETSDNMDSWKAEVRRVRRDKIRRKKMQMREKVGKSRNTVFFQWFVAPVGRKVGSLKRRVRSQLARWEMKNCTPLWREAHFQLKMNKTHHGRTTFWSCDVKKVHAVVARSTFASQKTTFGSCDVEKVHAVVARSTFRSQKC